VHLLEEGSKSDILLFLDDISEASVVCKIGIRALLASALEIKKGFTSTIQLLDKMQQMSRQSLPSGDNFVIRFVSFISSAGGRMQILDEKIKEAESAVVKLIRYFGEDVEMEQPETIFAMLKSFQEDLVV
jgi:hypothetical protein